MEITDKNNTPQNYGGYIRTSKNRKFFFGDLENNEYDIEEIAHSLALQCRWTGHCRVFYSIAEHSVHVHNHVPSAFKKEALLHDASEGYVVDLSRPLKEFVPDYRKIQGKVEDVIARRFNVPYPMTEPVREADDRMLVTEWNNLFDATDILLGVKNEPYENCIEGWEPKTAEKKFLEAYSCI